MTVESPALDAATPWVLLPGDTIKRTHLHNQYGGSRQGGISPSRKTPNVIVFTDPAVGALHGYFDRWEGEVLHYTGEGQQGDQSMDHGNRAILEHVDAGRSLRVFEGSAGVVTYIGEFAVDPVNPWYFADAPPTGGGPLRKVIMFRLLPVGEVYHQGVVLQPSSIAPTLDTAYKLVDEEKGVSSTTPFEVDPDVVDRGVKGHKATQNAVADVLKAAGLAPLSPGPGDPAFDVGWWRGDVMWVAEVKSLTAVNEVGQMRLAIGQVLDYAHQIRASGRSVQPVIVTETQPQSDRWAELCAELDIKLAWPGVLGELVA